MHPGESATRDVTGARDVTGGRCRFTSINVMHTRYVFVAAAITEQGQAIANIAVDQVDRGVCANARPCV